MEYNPWTSNHFRNWIHELLNRKVNVLTSAAVSSPCDRRTDCENKIPLTAVPTVRNNCISASPVSCDTGYSPDVPFTNLTTVLSADSNDRTTAKLPLLCKLLAWCPFDVRADGDCRLAGLYKCSLDGSLQFVKSALVVHVSDCGRFIRTTDNQLYELRGSISWWIFSYLHEECDIPNLPPHLSSAFSNGFPTHRWRSWIQGLYYFLSNATLSVNSGSLDSVKTGSETTPALQFTNEGLKQTLRSTSPYAHILSSYQPVTHLDLPSKSDLSSPSAKNRSMGGSDEQSFENPTSPTGSNFSSEYESISKRQNARKLAGSFKNLSVVDGSDVDSTVDVSRMQQKDGRLKLVHHPRLPSARKMKPGRPRKTVRPAKLWRQEKVPLSRKFKIVTGDGQTIDSSSLEQTRSGRWIIPRLSLRK